MSKIAFIFPGQGAQKAGMGKDFYENSKTAAEVIDRASELLGLDMKALCFEENNLLDQTEYTQAALVTVCMAMEKVLRERGLAPDVTAGLSLGEYCAIASAGGMSTENAITTVRKRGILMQNAVPGGQGAMAAVLGLDAGKIEKVLADRRDRGSLQGMQHSREHCRTSQLQLSGTDCDYRMEGRCGTGSRCTEGSRSKESPSA